MVHDADHIIICTFLATFHVKQLDLVGVWPFRAGVDRSSHRIPDPAIHASIQGTETSSARCSPSFVPADQPGLWSSTGTLRLQ